MGERKKTYLWINVGLKVKDLKLKKNITGNLILLRGKEGMQKLKSKKGRGKRNDKIKVGEAGITFQKEAKEKGNLFFRKNKTKQNRKHNLPK